MDRIKKCILLSVVLLSSLIAHAQPPTVTFNPANASTGVAQNTIITITFSEPMRIITGEVNLTSTNVDAQCSLKFTDASGATIPFNATVNGTDDVITITPNTVLPPLTLIYVAVAGLESTVDDDDIVLADITFTTADNTTPSITFNPTNGTTNVPVAGNLTISFNEAVRNISDSDIDDLNVSSLITLKLTNAGGADVPFVATINGTDTQITINPSSDLNSDQTYYLSIAPVEDASNNATTASNITFSTPDTQPPVPTSSPVNGATGVNETDDIILTFNEAIRRSFDDFNMGNTSIDGRITLRLNNAAGADIPFDAQINGSDDEVTIDPSSPLPSNATIYVAITDVEDGNNNLINPNPFTFTFSTGDAQPPTITNTVPADEAGSVLISTNTLQITFNENVVFDGDNTDNDNRIRIRNVTTSAWADTIALANVNVAGNVVTITFDATLAPSTNYAIQIGNSVFKDANNNFFTGITNNTTWDFDTEAGPNITSYSADPTCMGETINIVGTNFGTAPTVTVNGISVTPSISTPTSITITVPTTTAGNATVVVTNTNNGLSDSDNNLTLKDAIATTRPMAANPSAPAVNENFNIQVGSTQLGVNYTVREGGVGPFTNSTAGTGGTISFGPFDQNSDGSFLYEVRASSGGCTNQTYSISVIIAALSANAGPDSTICNGDSVKLGGDIQLPTSSGGNGYYSIKWYELPSSVPFSSASNPVVKPSTTKTYRVVVSTVGPVASVQDDVTITVDQPTNKNLIDINLTPSNPNNTYQKEDTNPVTLSFMVSGSPGSFTGQTRFEGPGVNSNGPAKSFYPNAANVGGNQIDLYYENPEGCITKDSVLVFVRDQNLYLNGLNQEYCRENNIDNLTVNTPVVTLPVGFEICFFTCGPLTLFQGTRYTYLGRTRLRNVNLAFDTVANAAAFNYTGTDLNLNTEYLTEGSKQFEILYRVEVLNWSSTAPGYTVVSTFDEFVTVPFKVIEKPVVIFGSFETSPCENDSPFLLDVQPAGGNFTLNGSPTSNTFDPSTTGLPNSNNLVYTYTDPRTSCLNSAQTTILISRLPDITDLDFENGCVNDSISFTPVFNNPQNINFKYSWDADGFDGYETNIPNNTPSTIKRAYPVASNYPIKLLLTTVDGCTTERMESITIGQVPDLTMSWSNVCDGDQTRFALKSNFFKNNLSDVDSVQWNFGDGNFFGKKNPVMADSVRNYTYATTDYFEATVTVVTDLNCRRTDTVSVYKVSKTWPIGDQEYFEDFNDIDFEDQGWKTGGTSSSWDWGTPAAEYISQDSPGGGKAWVTNLAGTYNTNEDSWLHSPCFNLSEIERPVLSFDLRSLTRDGVDGMVLQYNSKGTTNRETDWKTVGSVGAGKNWYNRIAIGANPGNQTLLQTGWTGVTDTTTWREATIPLDNVLSSIPLSEKSRVRFRFAFASSDFTPEAEGFAIDNFKIAQRDRLVLLEHFTNTGGVNTPSEPNKAVNQAINNFITNSSGEVMKLEYHLGVGGPNEDPIHLDNPVESNARAAFYGVSTTPATFIDSRHGNLQNIFSEQTLKPALVVIDTIITADTPAETLNVEVQFTPKTDLPQNSVLHIAVIERQIIRPEATGTNGETSFKYVMKKMLPDALGTRYPEGITANTTVTVNESWSPKAYALDSLSIIAFIQNEDTKEIYQTRYLKNPTLPDPTLITGMEPTFAEQIIIFPNPAESEVIIQLPGKARQAMPVSMIDGFGREVYRNQFKTGEHAKKIDTSALSGGVYILQIKAANGEVARKKVMIVNK